MITVTIESGRRLKLAFPYNPVLVAFIKSVPGSQFDKATKTWTAPLSVWDLLIERFPEYVEADYDVHVVVDDRPRRFAQNLLYMGVRFYLDGDRVIADGAGVSPLLQAEVDKRAGAIAGLLRAGALVEPDQSPAQAAPAPADVLTAHEERVLAAVRKGSQSAFEAEEKERTQRKRQQERTKTSTQQAFQWNR